MTNEIQVTQLSAEAWVSIAAPTQSWVTQCAAEIWVYIQRPNQIWTTQARSEVWVYIHRPNDDWSTQLSAEVWVSRRVLGLTYPVYPTLDGLGYSVFWAPEFANLPTQIAANKAEIDLSLADEPIHEFELTYDFLRNYVTPDEFKTLMGFFLRLKANAGRFLFTNPDDNSVVGEVVGVTDGVATDFGPLSRTFGVAPNVGVETVGYVNELQPSVVYLDGVPVSSSAYSFDKTFPKRQMLSFLLAPLAGQTITIDYSYYYYVKFAADKMSFEKFMSTLWTVKKVTLRSLRYLT